MAFSSGFPYSFGQQETSDPEIQSTGSGNDRNSGVLGWLSYEVFRKDMLDRKLESHHITGIAFSGAVGIGLFSTSGEIIALGGPVGTLLAFVLASLVVFSVMRCLAEMVSVRPVTAPLIDFPHTFVDEALGFTVGFMYWSVHSQDSQNRPCLGHNYSLASHLLCLAHPVESRGKRLMSNDC